MGAPLLGAGTWAGRPDAAQRARSHLVAGDAQQIQYDEHNGSLGSSFGYLLPLACIV
jgi:hypothetical protein